jgi:hypothetical protein
MSIELPAIDDRSFDDLVREALARLPAYAPEWTNHNVSDPGITLVELLAYFSEILLYRMARIPPASKLQFLRLLTGGSAPAQDVAAGNGTDAIGLAISDAVRALSQVDCAVTAEDFERLAERAANGHLQAEQSVSAFCIPGRNLEGEAKDHARRAGKADVSVLLVPAQPLADEAGAALCAAVRRELLPRCLLGTHLHVSGPIYRHVGVGVKLAPVPGRQGEALRRDVAGALTQHFSYRAAREMDGGRDDDRPRLGRPLYLSEIISTIDRVDGVDYVVEVTALQLGAERDALASPRNGIGIQIGVRSTVGTDSWLGSASRTDGARLLRSDSGRLLGIGLQPWELPDLLLIDEAFVTLIERAHAPGQPPGGRDA